MRLMRALVCGLALICSTPSIALAQTPLSNQPAANASAELLGLWKAKRSFGPFARGPLLIKRTGATYIADMNGRTLPIHIDKNELSFALPNGEGTFKGKFQVGGAIFALWTPPGSIAHGGYATPVNLKPDGPNRWTGQVVPFEDIFTFYLLVQKRPDGSLGALLRNTERDFGFQLGVQRLTVEGNVVKLIGKRRGQKDERELSSGTYDAENKILSLVFPSRGGSYDFTRDTEQSDFYPRGKNPGRYAYLPPPARDDAWPTGSLADVGIDRAATEKFIQTIIDMPMDTADIPQVHAVLLARHGKLVLEEYFHGEHRDKLHETRSAAKSMTATIVGAAIEAGAPLKVSTPVYQIMNGGVFPDDLEPLKRAMTLEHLLTMSSGYFCDDNNPDAPGNEEVMADQTNEPDYYRYTMKVPMAMPPGQKAIYCSANPNLALGVVGKAMGESPVYTFERLIAGPLKIQRYGWALDPAGHPFGGGSMQFLPRDFMKMGQLMLNGGTWQGRKILSRDFVTRASSPLYRIGERPYGYLWWYADYPYKARVVHTYSALGRGGQIITVVPELDLVIASFGGSYSSEGWRWFQSEAIPKYILTAVQ